MQVFFLCNFPVPNAMNVSREYTYCVIWCWFQYLGMWYLNTFQITKLLRLHAQRLKLAVISKCKMILSWVKGRVSMVLYYLLALFLDTLWVTRVYFWSWVKGLCYGASPFLIFFSSQSVTINFRVYLTLIAGSNVKKIVAFFVF